MRVVIIVIIYVVIPLIVQAVNKSNAPLTSGDKDTGNRSNWQCAVCNKSNRYYMSACTCGNTKTENASKQKQKEQLDQYCKRGYSVKDENGLEIKYKSNDYRFWEALLRKKTGNFKSITSDSHYLTKCMDRIKALAPEEKYNEINSEYCEFIKSVSEDLINRKVKQKKEFITCCENDVSQINKLMQSLEFSDGACARRRKSADSMVRTFIVISVMFALLAVAAFILSSLMVHLKLLDLLNTVGGVMIFFTVASIALAAWFIYDRKLVNDGADKTTKYNARRREELNGELDRCNEQIRLASDYIMSDRDALMRKIYEEYTGQ